MTTRLYVAERDTPPAVERRWAHQAEYINICHHAITYELQQIAPGVHVGRSAYTWLTNVVVTISR